MRSVVFEIAFGGQVYTFDGVQGASNVWSTSVSSFSDGEASWRVIATDGAKRGGNRGATQSFAFTVDAGGDTGTGGGGGGGSGGGTGGGGGGDPEPGADVTASVSAYKRRGSCRTWDYSWSGATMASVDIYLDGARAATTANDGSYTLTSGQKGSMSHAHRVCEAGSTTVCSPTVNTTF